MLLPVNWSAHPVPAGPASSSRDQAAAQRQARCCVDPPQGQGEGSKSVWVDPERHRAETCAPHPSPPVCGLTCTVSHGPLHAQPSLTCWSLPLSRKPGRAPRAMAKPQRVISSGLCSSARYFSTSPSGKKPQVTTRPRCAPLLLTAYQEREPNGGQRGGREEGLRPRSRCAVKGESMGGLQKLCGWF